MAVDTLGHLLALKVTPVNQDDRTQVDGCDFEGEQVPQRINGHMNLTNLTSVTLLVAVVTRSRSAFQR